MNADKLNDLFANVGPSLAANFPDTKSLPFSGREISHYFFISNTTPDEVMKMIKILPNKTSTGHENRVCKV